MGDADLKPLLKLIKWGNALDVILKTPDWLIINKPTGLSSQAAFAGDMGVEEWIALYWREKVHIFSRLDKGTSGVMVLARTKAAARRGEMLQTDAECEKEYVFLSHRDLQKSANSSAWTVTTPIGGKSAKTCFQKIGPAGKYFLYQARITQGRLHQIRRHAKESAVPILGDTEYGGAVFPRLCLHCKRVRWPDLSEPLEAPVPPSMGSLGDFQSDPDFLVTFDRRLKFFNGVTTAFRVVHRGEMKRLDVAIDCYGKYLCAWIYDEDISPAVAEAQLTPYFKKLYHVYKARGAVLKFNRRNPHNQGLVETHRVIGEAPPKFFTVEEGGLSYEVSLSETQHAGLFLDQRENRLRLKHLAAGKRVANLFCYTGAFSLVATAAGCEVVFSVDAAAPCLEIAKAGFARNGLADGRGKFVQEDVRSWLKRQERKCREDSGASRFDIVICDPPTFATTKTGGVFSVAKEWEELARSSRAILNADGCAFFSNNHREAPHATYLDALTRHFSRVDNVAPPLDFPRLTGEPEHVKLFQCWP